jgi:hypothetical protein
MKCEKGPFRVAADTERFTYSILGLTETLHDLQDIWGKQAKSLTKYQKSGCRFLLGLFYVQSKSMRYSALSQVLSLAY